MYQRFLIHAFEAWAIARLLRSPTFHRIVHNAHGKFHELRHGKIPSGLDRDEPTRSGSGQFWKYFKEELRDQFWGVRKK